jgi:hypothetical protein
MKIYQAVQKLFSCGQTERQTGDLISLLSFLESKLKYYNNGIGLIIKVMSLAKSFSDWDGVYHLHYKKFSDL